MTRWLLLVFALIIAASDLALLLTGGVEKTYSREILSLSKQFPVIPFVCGFVAGHVFWPQKV